MEAPHAAPFRSLHHLAAPLPRPSMIIRAVHLPSNLYVSLPTRPGGPLRDVPPWEGATDYVTDGARYGVRFHNGTVFWLEGSEAVRADELREDFAGVDLEAVIEGLHRYIAQDERLRSIWAGDLEALERARDQPPTTESRSP